MKRMGVMLGVAVSCLCTAAATAKNTEKIALWPLFVFDSHDNVTHVEVLGPFLTVRRSPEKDIYRFLAFAGYSRNHNLKESDWDFIWPIWRLWYGDSGKYYAALTPLFFGRENKDENGFVLFPEFWWFRFGAAHYTIVLLPWARHRDGDDGYFNLLTPAYWGRQGEERSAGLIPIVFWEKDGEKDYTLIVLPFFHDQKDPQHKTTGFLPWWVTRRGERQLANFFPVIWEKIGDRYDTFLVLPLFYRVGDNRVFLPLFWDVGQTFLVLPLYGKGEMRDLRWMTVVPPTYIRLNKGDYTEHNVLWPVFAWGDGPDLKRRAFRPVYDYLRKGPYVQHSALQQLLALGRGGGRHLDRVFPLFNFDRAENRHDYALLWPLYRDKATENSRARRVLSLLPIGLLKRGKFAQSWHLLNLIWSGKTGKPGAPDDHEMTHGFYPLYSFNKETRPASGSVVTNHWRFLDPLTPLDSSEIDLSEGPQELLLPFFEIVRSADGGQKWRMPLGMFRWEKRTAVHPWKSLMIGTFFVFYLHRWEGDRAGHELHLLSLFWDTMRNEYHSQGLWPLYSYRSKKEGLLNVSFLDPLWFLWDAGEEEQHVSALFKIFDYRRKSNGDSVFSFIWRAYRREVRGDTVSSEMFPFLSWEKSPDRSGFSFGWRLFSYRKEDGKRRLHLLFLPVK